VNQPGGTPVNVGAADGVSDAVSASAESVASRENMGSGSVNELAGGAPWWRPRPRRCDDIARKTNRPKKITSAIQELWTPYP
jgi:hypothetical protein